MSISFPSALFATFRGAPETAILKITKVNDTLQYGIETTLTSHTQETLTNFRTLLGEERFIHLCHQEEIRVNYFRLESNTLHLTKKIVRKFFIGYAYLELCNPAPRGTFTVRSMAEIDQLMMGHSPGIHAFFMDRVESSGKGLRGLTERVYLTYLHYNQVIDNQFLDKNQLRIRDVEFLTSRLGDREFQPDTIVFLSDGIFTVKANFIGKGAYVTFLVSPDKNIPPKIVCRGTATRRTATEGLNSAINDLLFEIGSLGVKTIWPALSRYLVDNQIKTVDILGKSLGGAHAQQLAILIEGIKKIRVNSLTTFGSVGVGEDICILFATQVLANRKDDPFNLCVIRNGGNDGVHSVDYIPAIGGEHIGSWDPDRRCQKEVVYIVPSDVDSISHSANVTTLSAEGGLCGLSYDFIRSFMTAHPRQTTLGPFAAKKITDPHEVDTHLGFGRWLEPYRQRIAFAFDLFTCRKFNKETFTDYYYTEANEQP